MEPKIIAYQPQYKQHFIDLNTAWLEEYFFVEQHDKDVFDNVEEVVLKPGGEIFFCLIGDEVVGTVALQKVNDSVIEMAKLAVDKKHQGKKLGNLLVDTCIDFARKNNYKTLMLVSSTKLNTALNLYRKYGFTETPLQETDYHRADIQMELYL